MNRIRSSAPIVRAGLALLAATVLAIAAPATEALAHGRGHHRHAHVAPHRAHARVALPAAYRTHLAGDVYYRPHRHRHVVYRIPVVAGGVVTYRPRVYCGGAPFPVAAAPTDADGWLSIGVRLPGISIAASVPIDD